MASPRDPLAAWKRIVADVRRLVRAGNLDARAGSSSIRETVHHVVEANVVAASIVIAALGSPGCTYAWSWMMPFGSWMTRMRYDRKPLGPTLRLLAALNAYVVAQVAPLPDGLRRTVFLRDAPRAEPRRVTVADVLLQEADHASEEVAAALAARRGGKSRH
jgi:hypothetical protein